MASRGDALSGYLPGTGDTSGVKVYSSEMKSETISGTVTSANVVKAITHHLGKVPTFIGLTTKAAAGEELNVSGSVVVALAAASAATSAKFYVVGNKGGVKFSAFILI